MKNTYALVLFIVIGGGIILFLIINAIRRREITFQGKVIDKDVVETQVNNMDNMNNGLNVGGVGMRNNGGVRHEYKIKVQTDSGKTIKYKISEGMYQIVNIGDTVSKASGTTEIQIVNSVSNQVNSPTTPITQTYTVTPTNPIAPTIPLTTPPTTIPPANNINDPTPPTNPAA